MIMCAASGTDQPPLAIKSLAYLPSALRPRDARETSRNTRNQVVDLASSTSRKQVTGLADRMRVRVRAAMPTAAINTEQEETLANLLVARDIARVDLGIELLIAQPG